MALDSLPAFHPSWPEEAQSLVRRAIDRHGGWSLWHRLESVKMTPRSLHGLLPWLKGFGRSFGLPESLTARPRRCTTEFSEYPTKGSRGIFESGEVRLLDVVSGRVTSEHPNYRRKFRGLGKYRRWSPLDALYFFGYAFSSYTSVPFVLPSLRFLALVSGGWKGERLRGVRVEFPADTHVHSRVQSYFFDSTGLLKRNDYVADIVAPWALAAHGWEHHAHLEGLPIPTRRIVFARLGSAPMPFATMLSAEFDGLEVRLTGA